MSNPNTTPEAYRLIPLSKKVDYVQASPIRKITAILAEARRRKDLIAFGGGAPSLPPPQEVVEETADRLKRDPANSVCYMGTRGIPGLLDLISQEVRQDQRRPEEGDPDHGWGDGGDTPLPHGHNRPRRRGDHNRPNIPGLP
ncbi:MAG: hypothetical protein ACE5Z5_13845 [Candidatus Bathyarchaeia archaeon]